MTENKNLQQWMQQRGLTNSELAEEMNFSYDLIYKLVTDQREITDAFKWRFAQIFGYEEATRLFDQPPAANHQPPAANHQPPKAINQ